MVFPWMKLLPNGKANTKIWSRSFLCIDAKLYERNQRERRGDVTSNSLLPIALLLQQSAIYSYYSTCSSHFLGDPPIALTIILTGAILTDLPILPAPRNLFPSGFLLVCRSQAQPILGSKQKSQKPESRPHFKSSFPLIQLLKAPVSSSWATFFKPFPIVQW